MKIYNCWNNNLKPLVEADYCEMVYKRERPIRMIIVLIALGLLLISTLANLL